MTANSEKTGVGDVACDWARRADDLAGWARRRLVNRRDCYGGYRPPEEWGREFRRPDGMPGRLGQQTTHKRPVTHTRLARHFRATGRADVIGMHTTSPENMSRWGAVEVDWHSPASAAPEVNLAAALYWYEILVRLRFRPLLTDSNGRGGFHVLILFAEPASTEVVFAFLQWLVRDYRGRGLGAQPETFPKQARVEPGRFGNWLRVVGKHHTHPHWSRVWDGGRWLEGAAAVEFILSLDGDPASLIPTDAATPAASTPVLARRLKVAQSLPEAATLVKELQEFQVKITPAANETFGTWREGAHDDLVLAVAIAAWVGERMRRAVVS